VLVAYKYNGLHTGAQGVFITMEANNHGHHAIFLTFYAKHAFCKSHILVKINKIQNSALSKGS
jgi:hypothetical protein